MVTIDGIDNSSWSIDEQSNGTINIRHNTGPTVTVKSDGSFVVADGDLTDGTNLIYDRTNGWVPLAILEASQYTVTGGVGIKNGGTASIGGSLSLDIEPADFAGGGLSDDGADNLQANLGNALALDGADNIAVSAGGIGTNELDEGILPNWTSSHTWNTSTGADLSIDETGLSYSTSAAETLSVQNTGTGSVTIQEDGTPVVKETRALTGGNAIDAIGDLSADRTVAVSAGGIGTNELDESILPNWTGAHTWNTSTGADLSIDETGLSYSTANAETLNIQNSGTGSVTVQEDGTPVVKETRALTGGNAIDAIGDLSADRTVAVSSNSIGNNELASARAADTDTQSGDGTATTFTIAHSLGVTPTVAHVQPESADAMGDFYVSAKTSTSIDVTYATAPASGTSNLSWGIITME